MHKLLIFILINITIYACVDSPSDTLDTRDYCSMTDRLLHDHTHTSIDISSLERPSKTGVYVLENGSDAITSRAWLSANAQKTMDIQYFIFSEDNIGIISCDYMLRAACHGVRVRVIVDDLLMSSNPDYILALDLHENIDIKIYNPKLTVGQNLVDKAYNGLTDFRGVNQRMHHKTFIVDGNIAITGGRNIADEYFDFDHEYNFRDRDILLVGGEAKAIQSEFDKYWESELSVDITELVSFSDREYNPIGLYQWINDYSIDTSNFWTAIRDDIPHILERIIQSPQYHYVDHVSFVSDAPGKNDGNSGLAGKGITTDALIQLVNAAQKQVHIQSPYLVTSDISIDLFTNAINRGVEITILTNSLLSTDNIEAFSGYQRGRSRLLNAGVNIYEYKPNAQIRKEVMDSDLQRKMDFQPTFGLHAKSMVIDDSISVIGTFNLDPRSAHLNTECITVVHSTEVASDMLYLMEKELLPENAWHITQDFNPDHLANTKKRIKTFTRRLIPKSVL